MQQQGGPPTKAPTVLTPEKEKQLKQRAFGDLHVYFKEKCLFDGGLLTVFTQFDALLWEQNVKAPRQNRGSGCIPAIKQRGCGNATALHSPQSLKPTAFTVNKTVSPIECAYLADGTNNCVTFEGLPDGVAVYPVPNGTVGGQVNLVVADDAPTGLKKSGMRCDVSIRFGDNNELARKRIDPCTLPGETFTLPFGSGTKGGSISVGVVDCDLANEPVFVPGSSTSIDFTISFGEDVAMGAYTFNVRCLERTGVELFNLGLATGIQYLGPSGETEEPIGYECELFGCDYKGLDIDINQFYRILLAAIWMFFVLVSLVLGLGNQKEDVKETYSVTSLYYTLLFGFTGIIFLVVLGNDWNPNFLSIPQNVVKTGLVLMIASPLLCASLFGAGDLQFVLLNYVQYMLLYATRINVGGTFTWCKMDEVVWEKPLDPARAAPEDDPTAVRPGVFLCAHDFVSLYGTGDGLNVLKMKAEYVVKTQLMRLYVVVSWLTTNIFLLFLFIAFLTIQDYYALLFLIGCFYCIPYVLGSLAFRLKYQYTMKFVPIIAILAWVVSMVAAIFFLSLVTGNEVWHLKDDVGLGLAISLQALSVLTFVASLLPVGNLTVVVFATSDLELLKKKVKTSITLLCCSVFLAGAVEGLWLYVLIYLQTFKSGFIYNFIGLGLSLLATALCWGDGKEAFNAWFSNKFLPKSLKSVHKDLKKHTMRSEAQRNKRRLIQDHNRRQLKLGRVRIYLNSMLSLNRSDPLFDKAKNMASQALAEAEASMGRCRFLDEDTGTGSDGNDPYSSFRHNDVEESNNEQKDFEEKLGNAMEYIQELQMMTTSVNRMNVVRDERARALQYTVDEMTSKIKETERETTEERFYENRKDSIERLLDVIDAADEFGRICKDVDAFHWKNRGFAVELHKAVSKCESAFHSLYGKEIQRRSADLKEAKKLLHWCQELAKEIRQLPSDGSDEGAYHISEFEAHVSEMEKLVSRGESAMRSSGEEFGEAWTAVTHKMDDVWVDARSLDKRRKEDQRLRWSQLMDTFDALKGTTKKEQEVDDEESFKAVHQAKNALGRLQQAIQASRREFDDAEWKAQEQIKWAEETVQARKDARNASRKRNNLFATESSNSMNGGDSSSSPLPSRPPRGSTKMIGKPW